MKTKEQREDERERLTAELRKKREVKRKKLREQLRKSTDDDVVMHGPLSPHQLSTAKGKVVDYIASNIPFIQTAAHVVQLWDYNAEHSVAPRGDCSRSADSAAVKAALVDKTIVPGTTRYQYQDNYVCLFLTFFFYLSYLYLW